MSAAPCHARPPPTASTKNNSVSKIGVLTVWKNPPSCVTHAAETAFSEVPHFIMQQLVHSTYNRQSWLESPLAMKGPYRHQSFRGTFFLGCREAITYSFLLSSDRPIIRVCSILLVWELLLIIMYTRLILYHSFVISMVYYDHHVTVS